MSKIDKVLGILDKLDDIVYTPINLVCDWAKRPLIQMDEKNKREQMKLENELKILEKTEVQKRLNDIDIEYQKSQAEIQKYISDNNFENGKHIIETIENYRKTMMDNMVESSAQILIMNDEGRARAVAMIEEKTRSYKSMQREQQYEDAKQLRLMSEMFGDSPEIKTEIEKRAIVLIDKYMSETEDLVKKLNDGLDQINKTVQDTTSNIQQILKTMMDKMTRELGEGIRIRNNDALSVSNTDLLESGTLDK